MSTVVQISTIQFRRGPQANIPGFPSAIQPSVPTTGLAPAEIGVATDTGRVFMGIDPNATPTTPPSLGRVSFPYQNIELLTEFSYDALQTAFDFRARDMHSAYLTTNPIAANDPNNAADWTDIQLVPAFGQPNVSFRIDNPGFGACAQITYFLYMAATPLRTGKLTVLYSAPTDAAAPMLLDEGLTLANVDKGLADPTTGPQLAHGDIQFRAIATQSGAVLQCRNLSTAILTMFFRIERPFLGAPPVTSSLYNDGAAGMIGSSSAQIGLIAQTPSGIAISGDLRVNGSVQGELDSGLF